MFATLVLEREPLKLEDLPEALRTWLLVGGGFAAFALVVWFLRYLAVGPGPARDERQWSWTGLLATIALGGLAVVCLPAALQILFNSLGWTEPPPASGKSSWSGPLEQTFSKTPQFAVFPYEGVLIHFGAACAVVAVLLPLLLNLGRLRPRRIWAMAKLAFKEAIRRRVLWAFSLLLLVFLFASWFLPTNKPEDQLRNYVNLVYPVMTVLLLVTSALLTAFSLPADLRNQTIHTIVTKPVERFEIILGRFLGYTFLMTLVLVVMTSFSLLYVYRTIDPEAKEESYKARVPVYGNLDITGGKNVGYEWEYRQYISGGVKDEYAVWTFPSLPRSLTQRNEDTVPCEFTFEIFRTTKGPEENKGILCSFAFENWQCELGQDPGYPKDLEKFRKEWNELRTSADLEGEKRWEPVVDRLAKENNVAATALTDEQMLAAIRQQLGQDKQLPAAGLAEEEVRKALVDMKRMAIRAKQTQKHGPDKVTADVMLAGVNNYVAAKYHFFEVPSKEIVDFHTLSVDVPTDLFNNMGAWQAGPGRRPPLRVVVRCDSRTQYLGVAKYDLYLLDATRGFEQNFFKGAVGLWYRMCLVIAIALTCSTYLSGVISFLVTMVLYLGGIFIDYISQVAKHQALGGGPLEAFLRLVGREHTSLPLDQSAIVTLMQNTDKGFEFGLRIFVAMLPDVNRFSLTDLVAEGFNISGLQLSLTAWYLAGYLLLWMVASFYLIRAREVAA
jgi:ABC-type transport system involved in multi-copper enzyme maturation permease subunit